jgi:hypothetical protein
MPKIFNPFILILFFFGHALWSQPILKIEDSKKNFGFVKRGKVILFEYKIENSGNEPLLLTDAKVECSCTKVEIPSRPILPKEKAKIIVNFNTQTVYDRQDRLIQIFSNDKNSPATLRFKGVVINK